MEYLLFRKGKKNQMMEKVNQEEMMIKCTITTKSSPYQSIPTLRPFKIYNNPVFSHRHHHHHQSQPPPCKHHQQCFKMKKTELEIARAQIMELKSELELEKNLRKKVESVAKRMAKELAEVRRSRYSEELEIRVCYHKGEIEKEMEEERRMLKIAEVIREERVQMKLEDAKLFYEEKMIKFEQDDQCRKTGEEQKPIRVPIEKERKGIQMPAENPHIRRGIKGFVEFPRGLRSVESNRSNRNHKIECQKAQLRILLKEKSPLQPTSLAIS